MFKRKTRTFLTLLGVILGSAAVTLTFAIGEAFRQNNEQILESTGLLRYIQVYNGDLYSDSSSNSSDNKVYIDDKFIKNAKLFQIDDGKIKKIKEVI